MSSWRRFEFVAEPVSVTSAVDDEVPSRRGRADELVEVDAAAADEIAAAYPAKVSTVEVSECSTVGPGEKQLKRCPVLEGLIHHEPAGSV